MGFAQSNGGTGHSQVTSLQGPRSGLELLGPVRCVEMRPGRGETERGLSVEEIGL